MAELTKQLSGFNLKDNTLIKAVKTNLKDKIEVEIGDSKQLDFKPQFKVMRWNNEVNFSMRAEEDPTATVDVENGIVKYKAKDYEVHQYEKPEVSEDGGYEFEWVLPKKPASNVLTASIQSKDLDFFYQPALTPEEIANGDSRSDNVIGSYAVYHKTKRDNIVGQNEYKTGKAFHIYRPEATDALDNKTWCELNITDDTLTVTVPQAYLDNASYPVVVDPTFGYTSIGVSSTHATTIKYSKDTTTSNGQITKMSVYFSATNLSIRAALYSDSAGAPNTLIESTGGTDAFSPVAWRDFLFTTNSLIINGTQYWLAVWTSNIQFAIYYDTGATGYGNENTGGAYPTWPGTATPAGTQTDRRWSLYVTYNIVPPVAWLSA